MMKSEGRGGREKVESYRGVVWSVWVSFEQSGTAENQLRPPRHTRDQDEREACGLGLAPLSLTGEMNKAYYVRVKPPYIALIVSARM
jgi:hypothetical protein